MDIRLRFFGAAGTVTGSRYLLETPDARILVDCGLFQEHELLDRNWAPSPFPASELTCVLLTHAHLDHCGLLPRLVKDGFHGKIITTGATLEIAKVVLADCAKINEEDALFKLRRHQREGRIPLHPEMPLYNLPEAKKVFSLFEEQDFNIPFPIAPGIEAEFLEAGHILGSASIKITIRQKREQRTIVFSGDVGRQNMPILRDPALIGEADYVLCESTYGDRLHGPQEDIPGLLAEVVNDTVQRGGNLVIPSFAIERTQDLLYYLAQLLKEDRIPHLQIFVDSPMAVKVSEIFRHHPHLFDRPTTALMRTFRIPSLQMIRTIEDSKSLNHIRGTAIIIAGSGMCTGGRIKHHLIANLPRRESTVLFVGYQANGTLGRIILDGTKRVRIHGAEYPVNARIARISGFSAHADRDELIHWLGSIPDAPRKLFVTHGEPEASQSLAQHITEKLGWQCQIPVFGETVSLP